MDSAIVCSGLGKKYGDKWATTAIDLAFEPGKVHAIVGENGAGKSTLMKLIAGVIAPDSGSLAIKGERIHEFTPRVSARLGVGMVYQELMLAPTLTVWENIVLGWEPSRRGFVDHQAARTAIAEMARHHQMSVPLDAIAGTLPIAHQQQVEILRVLYRGADIIILDEPTSVLTPQESDALFETIRSLAESGSTVLFISHKLHEVLNVAQTITVLRDGRLIDTIAREDADRDALARMIIGHDISPVHHSQTAEGPIVLDFREVGYRSPNGREALTNISFRLHSGRILGVAGVAGSGQTELADVVAGSVMPTAGQAIVTIGDSDAIHLEQKTRRGEVAVRLLRDRGMAHIPSDRNEVGTASTESLWFSELAGKYWRRGEVGGRALDLKAARARATELIAQYRVKAPSVDALPKQLSGGNLQKFILGRELSSSPSLILAEEPTRGVDIGSALAIRQQIRDQADAGAAVMLMSTDLDELLEISDDILVLFEGRSAGLFARDDVDAMKLGAAMTGLTGAARDAGEGRAI